MMIIENLNHKNTNIKSNLICKSFLTKDIQNHKANIPLINVQQSSSNHLQELHCQELLYNNNKIQLLHCAEKTRKLLNNLIKFNNKYEWIIHYPLSYNNNELYKINKKDIEKSKSKKKLDFLIRTKSCEHIYFINNKNQEKYNFKIFCNQLNVLKLDLRFGGIATVELTQLEKSTIRPLLNKKIIENIKHIEMLIKRIKNNSSRILVTGDLNSGKSAFCNALLRQKILPEDQQPCTEVFCEILDSYGNFGKEEVHAIPHGIKYNQQDSSTYTILKIHDLNKIVIDSEKWSYIKIYINDKRTKNESILRNGTLDIALIDSPGLNFNSITTTALFSKQEEIDIIIFVVNAENHFTLSAKEFICNATNEKALIFIVVNKFDNIKDKQRCKNILLNQIIELSPETYHNASELIHFVSSILISENKTLDNSNFEKLEKDLRTFILEKRTESKLLPGKIYLKNLLADIKILCETNKQETNFQLQNLKKELKQIIPIYEQILEEKKKALNEVRKIIENICSLTSRYTYEHLSAAIAKIEDIKPCDYQGFLKAYNYAIKTKKKMLNYIELTINDSENFAKINTNKGINKINNLGIIHMKSFKKKIFQPQYMFSKQRNILKTIPIDINFFDFIDFKQDKHISTTLTITACTILGGRVVGYHNIITAVLNTFNIIGLRNFKKLTIPFICLAVFSICSYVVLSIPKVIPKKIAKKIKQEFKNSNFIYQNSLRITSECRKVLKYPQKDLHYLFQKTIKKQYSRKKEILKSSKISKHASNFFTKLSLQVEQQYEELNSINIRQS
ncbi:mitofusin [Pneumocystis jirovecii RU7]|uniref:Dynamin-type G domain-containing protein n=1 Tax=Pneumocystis jirovecii (strain RU7) TaxID=1408657 RepID=A0A0W4ZNJ3_PNEJ7|nr:mitofusin [Pneumocystis jirovecii RU7]KTW29941.1 hypothetical protein T551_01885 [Pneumocystis jirovecii RU7]